MRSFLLLCTLIAGGLAASIKGDSKDLLQNFYTLCDGDATVQCAVPAYEVGCYDFKNCTLAVAMETTDTGLVFSMFADSDVSYMSLGFSKDQDMGDDPVVQCLRDADNNVTASLSYNVGYKNEMIANDGLNFIEGSFEDGVIYCKVELDDTLKFARHTENYTAVSYYLIAAAGPLKDNGDLGLHTGFILNNKKWNIGEDLMQNFYALCESDTTAQCATPAYEADCFEFKNCTLAVAMETTKTGLIFSMFANTNVSYMSLGFSKDLDMGDDPVVQCVRDENDQITGQLSYNVGYKNERLPDDGLIFNEGSFVDGVIYCQVALEDTLKFARHLDNYTAVSYHLIAAAGSLKGNGDLGKHSGFILNSEKWKLGEAVHDDMYDLCAKDGVKCACAGTKTDRNGTECFPAKNCTKIIAMDAEGTFYMLATATSDVAYMSVGFSHDTDMGDEPVVACIRNETAVSGALSYNTGYKNARNADDNGLEMLEVKAEDDYIYCKFKLGDVLNFARHYGNNTEETFYIVGAAGTVQSDGSLGHHSGVLISSDMWQISSSTTVLSSLVLSVLAVLITRHL